MITLSRSDLLAPLRSVASVVDRRGAMPVLSTVLIQVTDGKLALRGTDLEVEVTASLPLDFVGDWSTCIPARKFLDIVKAAPDDAQIVIKPDTDRVQVKIGRGRYGMSVLDSDTFPAIDTGDAPYQVAVAADILQAVIGHTAYAMAQNDARYYLNGLLLQLDGQALRAVGTDGGRLAVSERDMKSDHTMSAIIPRKAVTELAKMLSAYDGEVQVRWSDNFVEFVMDRVSFLTKVIEGRFPDWQRVMPDAPHECRASRLELKGALSRTSILSNEKYKGLKINLSRDHMALSASNPDQDMAEESVDVAYTGNDLELGINVAFLLDAVNAIESEDIQIGLTDENSAVLIVDPDSQDDRHIVMPMRV